MPPNYDPNSDDYHYPPRHEPDAEIDRLRVELRDWQTSSEAYRHDAERAEARVAELECGPIAKQKAWLEGECERLEAQLANINRQSPGDAQCHVTLMLARAERAEARVVELEARNKHMETVLYDAQVLLGTEDIGELITGPTGPISRLIARAERAEAELEKCKTANASWQESYCKRHNDSIEQRERAERAEAKRDAT